MTIVISKQEIFNEVEKRSSLEGVMLPELFENVWASKEEGQFLDSYWIEGYTAVIQLLKRYIRSESVSYTIDSYDKNEALNINIEMPARYNSLLDGSVSTDIKMLIACNVLHGWLEIKAPQAALKYQEEAKGYSEDLRVKLLYRVAPGSQLVDADIDEEELSKEDEGSYKSSSDDIEINGSDNGSDEGLVCKDMCGETFINPEWEYINKARHDNVILRQGWGRCAPCERDRVSVDHFHGYNCEFKW